MTPEGSGQGGKRWKEVDKGQGGSKNRKCDGRQRADPDKGGKRMGFAQKFKQEQGNVGEKKRGWRGEL